MRLRRTSPAPPVRHVHLGLGSFFRAHQAWYTHRASDANAWGIAAFSGRSAELARTLAAQDGLFTLDVRGPDGDELEVVTSLVRTHGADDDDAWLTYLADPAVAILTTTVTEAGYLRGPDRHLDAEHPENSSLSLTIKAASIDTRNADRDGHLRSNDFFDMETYPTITFTSTAVEKTGDDTYRVTGDLTIKDVTKPVSVDFEYMGTAKDPFGNERLGLEGTTTINRKDWGVNWNAALDTGGVLVSEKVTLVFLEKTAC